MMPRRIAVLSVLVCAAGFAWGQAALPSFAGDEARRHELKPHRHTIPVPGVGHGYNQLDLTLTVSPTGAVTEAKVAADWGKELLVHWPKLRPEVMGWKYLPFEVGGKAATVQVKTALSLSPAEVLPEKHVAPPALGPDSVVEISVSHSPCYGTCPVYSVTLSTKDGIGFWGRSYVAQKGSQAAPLDAARVRELARAFVAADFYSMDAEYEAPVTDLPTTTLSITIDGQEKKVVDYAGTWVGMPAVIKDLEEEVEFVAGSAKWVRGADGNAPRPR